MTNHTAAKLLQVTEVLIAEDTNYRMAKVGMDSGGFVVQPLCLGMATQSIFPRICPDFQVSPRREAPQPFWATSACA